MTAKEADTLIEQWSISFHCKEAKRPAVEKEIRRLIADLAVEDVQQAMDDILSTVDVVRQPKSSFNLHSPVLLGKLRGLARERRIYMHERAATLARRKERNE